MPGLLGRLDATTTHSSPAKQLATALLCFSLGFLAACMTMGSFRRTDTGIVAASKQNYPIVTEASPPVSVPVTTTASQAESRLNFSTLDLVSPTAVPVSSGCFKSAASAAAVVAHPPPLNIHAEGTITPPAFKSVKLKGFNEACMLFSVGHVIEISAVVTGAAVKELRHLQLQLFSSEITVATFFNMTVEPSGSHDFRATASVRHELRDPGAFEVLVYARRWGRDLPNGETSVLGSCNIRVSLGASPDALPSTPCVTWVGGPGRYVTCAAMGNRLSNCPPDGWTFVPYSCFNPVLNMAAVSRLPWWIVIAGTSVSRGIFWALVDALLGPVRGASIAKTHYWKCWGMLDFRLGAFRVSYVDFRPLSFPEYVPVSVQAAYVPESLQLLRRLTSPRGLLDDNATPDAIVLELFPVTSDLVDMPVLERLIGSLSSSWRGRLLVTFHKPSLYAEYPATLKGIDALRSFLNTPVPRLRQLQYFDDSQASHVIGTGERGGNSVHLHYSCDRRGQHSCGMSLQVSVSGILFFLLTQSPQLLSNWSGVDRLQAMNSSVSDVLCLLLQAKSNTSDGQLMLGSTTPGTTGGSSGPVSPNPFALNPQDATFCLKCPAALSFTDLAWMALNGTTGNTLQCAMGHLPEEVAGSGIN
jgi:hypothetical protein